MKVSTRRIY